MTKLSVNVNKVALLRNSRTIGIPSVVRAAESCVQAGAHGITVHPRPDQRHIRPSDVYEIRDLLTRYPGVEFNIEGNPFPEYMDLVRDVRPTQCTLVPDSVNAPTSDHGWDLERERERLAPIVEQLVELGVRVSLFMDADSESWETARALGAARVELYTEPYASAYSEGDAFAELTQFAAAAKAARAAGLGVNAGHDLNLANLAAFCFSVPNVLEVSIGHALIADALDLGLKGAVRAYLDVLTG
jgi:pyridoxine 5-phosphate synthase